MSLPILQEIILQEHIVSYRIYDRSVDKNVISNKLRFTMYIYGEIIYVVKSRTKLAPGQSPGAHLIRLHMVWRIHPPQSPGVFDYSRRTQARSVPSLLHCNTLTYES